MQFYIGKLWKVDEQLAQKGVGIAVNTTMNLKEGF
jgi:hypothetical protein